MNINYNSKGHKSYFKAKRNNSFIIYIRQDNRPVRKVYLSKKQYYQYLFRENVLLAYLRFAQARKSVDYPSFLPVQISKSLNPFLSLINRFTLPVKLCLISFLLFIMMSVFDFRFYLSATEDSYSLSKMFDKFGEIVGDVLFTDTYAQLKSGNSFQYPDNPNSQINVNVTVKDKFTLAAIDSALVKLLRGQIVLDSGYTNSNGNLLLRFIPLSNNENITEVPTTFGISPSYPNPLTDKVKTNVSVPQSGQLEYALYDVLGNKILEGKQEVSAGSYQLSLEELNNLSQGVYLLQVVYNNQQVVVKLAKVGSMIAIRSGSVQAKISRANQFEPVYQSSPMKGEVLENVVLTVNKNRYISVSQNYNITKDTSITVDLTRQNNVSLANLYPNGQPVANAQIRVNNQTTYTANSQGIVELVLPSGQHRITSIDSRTTLDTLLMLVSDTLASVMHQEKIVFGWNPAQIN